jgi:hypothetical protein
MTSKAVQTFKDLLLKLHKGIFNFLKKIPNFFILKNWGFFPPKNRNLFIFSLEKNNPKISPVFLSKK